MKKNAITSKMKNKIVIVNGIKFLSKMEADFYEFLLQSNNADDIELQPRFALQPTFKKNGITHHSITYIADFRVKSKNLIYDVKGQKTIHFILKYKMFEYKYPELHLTLITACPLKYQHTYGKWIDIGVLNKLRSAAKRAIKKAKDEVE